MALPRFFPSLGKMCHISYQRSGIFCPTNFWETFNSPEWDSGQSEKPGVGSGNDCRVRAAHIEDDEASAHGVHNLTTEMRVLETFSWD